MPDGTTVLPNELDPAVAAMSLFVEAHLRVIVHKGADVGREFRGESGAQDQEIAA